jgi:uncharacterized coiled-coil protein SlyX
MPIESDTPDPVAQRSIELEARFSWLERHVAEQDKVILELADELNRLKREAQEVRRRLKEAGEADTEIEPEAPPPHY